VVTLHLIKLCVGCDSAEDLAGWIDGRRRQAAQSRRPFEHAHVTRMTPKRRDDLLDGGSLYWVIKGTIQVRQRLLDMRRFIDDAGTPRCRLVLAPDLVPTEWRPRRPFQGWRYLEADDAPADLIDLQDGALPAALRAELSQLGLR
jgi:hypothetical protein